MGKYIYTFLTAVLIATTALTQSPDKISYQAIVKNADGDLIAVNSVGMRISILQGSASGLAVYIETQTPTTNANGLISLEIGNGTAVAGDFSTIDWATGSYFIKTEIDPTGGIAYSITTTSQLLSVPYALHTRTAERAPENDPVFVASIASGITSSDRTNWNNKQNNLTAGIGIDISSNEISAIRYTVGDFAQGGVVFWVDETGQHGLVCAKTDQSAGIMWYAGSNIWTMARGDCPYSGEMNTAIIIAGQGYGDGTAYAARLCSELIITEGGKTYGDWYLPSQRELNYMYQNKTAIDATATANNGVAIASDFYWSSKEAANNGYAYRQYFENGQQNYASKNTACRVRAIRAF